jgi:uroporphyrinogen-III synthase
MPEDTGPLRRAVHELASGKFDAAVFTTSIQADHLMEMAESEGLVGAMREGLDRAVIASIGPTTTEALDNHGLRPDFEPTHPKMGMMIVELGRVIHALHEQKHRSRL